MCGSSGLSTSEPGGSSCVHSDDRNEHSLTKAAPATSQRLMSVFNEGFPICVTNTDDVVAYSLLNKIADTQQV